MASTYKPATRCVCGSYSHFDHDGRLAAHQVPGGGRCFDREERVDPPRAANPARVCRDCLMYLCTCLGVTLGMVLAAIVAIVLTGCANLSPGARAIGGAVLEDVLACGLPLAVGALAGEPDYIAASSCHLQRVGDRIGRALESAPEPSIDHGREVIRAAELDQAGEHRQARAVARECDATARAALGEGGAEP